MWLTSFLLCCNRVMKMNEEMAVCPKCGDGLESTEHNKYYFMCMKCIEGWTWEELMGILKYKRIMGMGKIVIEDTVTGNIDDPTYEFIVNNIAAMRDFLRSDTDLLDQGCGLYDDDGNQATYDALFATLNNGLWGLGK